jgi:hypothetical protein
MLGKVYCQIHENFLKILQTKVILVKLIQTTVNALIYGPGRLFFGPKILKIFTLVSPYVILLKGGRLLERAFK